MVASSRSALRNVPYARPRAHVNRGLFAERQFDEVLQLFGQFPADDCSQPLARRRLPLGICFSERRALAVHYGGTDA